MFSYKHLKKFFFNLCVLIKEAPVTRTFLLTAQEEKED